MIQEQVLSYKHLDEPLDQGRFVFECILAGNFQAFTKCSWLLSCSRHCTILCSCYGVKPFSWKFSASGCKIKCSFPVTCTERLHSWYWAKMEVSLVRSTHKFSELNFLQQIGSAFYLHKYSTPILLKWKATAEYSNCVEQLVLLFTNLILLQLPPRNRVVLLNTLPCEGSQFPSLTNSMVASCCFYHASQPSMIASQPSMIVSQPTWEYGMIGPQELP